jgi:hypothetical protein
MIPSGLCYHPPFKSKLLPPRPRPRSQTDLPSQAPLLPQGDRSVDSVRPCPPSDLLAQAEVEPPGGPATVRLSVLSALPSSLTPFRPPHGRAPFWGACSGPARFRYNDVCLNSKKYS